MNWTAFALGFLAMSAGIALYHWLSRSKRPQGHDRYAGPPIPSGDYARQATLQNLYGLATMLDKETRQLLIAALPPDDTPEREAALQALMTSIQGRFTSRSEEPNDA